VWKALTADSILPYALPGMTAVTGLVDAVHLRDQDRLIEEQHQRALRWRNASILSSRLIGREGTWDIIEFCSNGPIG
jgi:hypothetical protein